jgi:hypothetical protein
MWSDWPGFYVNAPIDHAPVVSGSDTSLALNATVAASNLFSVTDADGDAMKTYELWDSVNPASNAHDAPSTAVSGATGPQSMSRATREALFDLLPRPLRPSSPGLTGRSSNPCRFWSFTNARCGLLDHPLSRVMTLRNWQAL